MIFGIVLIVSIIIGAICNTIQKILYMDNNIYGRLYPISIFGVILSLVGMALIIAKIKIDNSSPIGYLSIVLGMAFIFGLLLKKFYTRIDEDIVSAMLETCAIVMLLCMTLIGIEWAGEILWKW